MSETLKEKATKAKAKVAAATAKKAPRAKKKIEEKDFDVESAAEAEVAQGAAVSEQESIKRITVLGELMLAAEKKVIAAELELKKAKEEFTRLERNDLPDLMAELGLNMFKLPDGSVFELVEDVTCGISEERRPAAHRWIRDNGYEGLIKTELKMTFSPDELQKATELANELDGRGFSPEEKETIHAARLKSFVKERLEKGDAIPFDLFGINPFNRVKVKQPKSK